MKAIIEPGSLAGSITAPPSKSMTQRALAAALLHKGKTIIYEAGNSNDELAALQIIQQLGANIIPEENMPPNEHRTPLTITSDGMPVATAHLQCGESGLSARLFTPIAALSSHPITINGAGSLLGRPMSGIGETLAALGVAVTNFNGYLPLTVQGPLQAKPVTINAGDSSQFLSGLLFALCNCATAPVVIEVEGLKSKPYIDMTLEVLSHFGKRVTHRNYEEFSINPDLFTYRETIEINIEADWSSAAFLLVGAAIAGQVTIRNLNAGSSQADRTIVDVLRSAGAEVVIEHEGVTVKKASLRAFEFDATHCPDLFPVLAVLAACCNGESYIAGVHRLFHKESNRAASITEMLQDFNVPFSIEDDSLCVRGVKCLQGTVIDSYNDHRIVMAAAIGGLRANGPVEITHAGPVNKSYPDFFGDFSLCGGKCTLM